MKHTDVVQCALSNVKDGAWVKSVQVDVLTSTTSPPTCPRSSPTYLFVQGGIGVMLNVDRLHQPRCLFYKRCYGGIERFLHSRHRQDYARTKVECECNWTRLVGRQVPTIRVCSTTDPPPPASLLQLLPTPETTHHQHKT